MVQQLVRQLVDTSLLPIIELSRGTEIAFYQNSFVISPDLLYHLIRRNNGRFEDEAIASNPIVSSKQWLYSLKLTN